jgi:hypothetical protein
MGKLSHIVSRNEFWQFCSTVFWLLNLYLEFFPRIVRIMVGTGVLLVFMWIAYRLNGTAVDVGPTKPKPSRSDLRKRYWDAARIAAWVLLPLAVAAAAMRFVVPVAWVGAAVFLHALETLGFLAFAVLLVLWVVRFDLERHGKALRLDDISAIQWALVLGIATISAASWDASWREFKFSTRGIASVALVFDRSQTTLATTAERICTDSGFAAAGIDLVCSGAGLPGGATGGDLDNRARQYSVLGGYQGAILLARPGKGMTDPTLLAWPSSQPETAIVLDDSVTPGQFYVDVLQHLALLKQSHGSDADIAALAHVAQAELAASGVALRARPVLVQLLVNSSLNLNDTAGLDQLGPVIGKTLLADDATFPQPPDVCHPIALRLTAVRWLSHIGLYDDADVVLQELVGQYGPWDGEVFRRPEVDTLAYQARAEIDLAKCQSSEEQDRAGACAEAVEHFEALRGKAPLALVAYNVGRAQVVAGTVAEPKRSGLVQPNDDHVHLEQVLSTSPRNCLHIDAARWLRFAETTDDAPEVKWQFYPDDAKCPFTVFVDRPHEIGDRETAVRVGLPLTGVELGIQAQGYMTETAPLIEESRGVYSGTFRLGIGPKDHRTFYLYLQHSQPPHIKLLQPVPVEVHDNLNRVLAAWSAYLARPLEVSVVLNDMELGQGETSRVITTTTDADVSIVAALQGLLPTLSEPAMLADQDILEKLSVCIGEPEDGVTGCGENTLARTEEAGIFQGSLKPELANDSAYLVKVTDRAGAIVASSEPFMIRRAVEPSTTVQEQVTVVMFKGEVWDTMHAANEKQASGSIGTFATCSAARLLEKPESLYLIQVEKESAKVQGYIRPEQVEFERTFGPTQLDRLWVGYDEVAIRGREGTVVYSEPECTVYEKKLEIGHLWQVTIYRPENALPVEGNYIDGVLSSVRHLKLPRR